MECVSEERLLKIVPEKYFHSFELRVFYDKKMLPKVFIYVYNGNQPTGISLCMANWVYIVQRCVKLGRGLGLF